jgi:hypothetical protein
MPIIKPTQDNFVYISDPIEQEFGDSNWTGYAPGYKGLGAPYVIEAATTNTNLVTISGIVLVEGDPVIVKDGTDTSVVRGNLGPVDIGSAPKDIKEVVFSGRDLLVDTQTNDPAGVRVAAGGSKVFLVGTASSEIYQYTLSTPYDLSSGSFDNITLSVSTENNPVDLNFNNNGTKMYVLGSSPNSVYQYTLTTPYNVSSASYDSVSFDASLQVSERGGVPISVELNTDGTKMFIAESTNIHQYLLSTAFDISTTTYDNVSVGFLPTENNYRSIAFNSDGTRLFTLHNDNRLYEYTLTTGFDLTTFPTGLSFSYAEYFSVNEENFPQGAGTGLRIDVTDDDSRIIVSGLTADGADGSTPALFDYGLTLTEYSADISSLGLTNAPTVVCRDSLPRMFSSFDLDPGRCISQDTNLDPVNSSTSTTTTFTTPISPLSSTMLAGDTVIPLDGKLSDPISGASYDGVEYRFVIDYDPEGIEFNDDGTKIFMVGIRSDSIYQFSLTTPFDVQTATYDQVRYDVSQLTLGDGAPVSIAFNNNGASLFVLVVTTIYQLTLESPYDLSGNVFSPSGASINLSTLAGELNAITFNNTGTKVYLADFNTVYEIELSTPFDITTIGIDSPAFTSFSLSTQENAVQDIVFNDVGTKMYVLGDNSNNIFQYSLSTAFDITSATYDNVSFNVNSQDSRARSIDFSNDGTKLAFIGDSSGDFFHYTLSTPYDISTLTFIGLGPNVFDKYGNDGNSFLNYPQSGTFSANGSRFFVVNTSSARILQYSLSTPFDISTMSTIETFYDVTDQDSFPYGVEFNDNGTKMYMSGGNFGELHEYDLSIAFDLTNGDGEPGVVFSALNVVNFNDGSEFVLNPDGTRLYILTFSGIVHQFDVAVPYDMSTATETGATSVDISAVGGSTFLGMAFGANGTKMFLLEADNDNVYEYDLSTAYDVTTASYTSVSLAVGAQETVPWAITFNDIGSKMYISGVNTGNINQYTLSTPFDLSTATFDSVIFSFVNQTGTYDLNFNNDGTKIYVIIGGRIYQYNLNTAYDISTMIDANDFIDIFTLTQDIPVNGGLSDPFSFEFNNDGSKLYAYEANNSRVAEFLLPTPFDVTSAVFRPNATVAYSNSPYSVSETFPYKVKFKPDGTKLYILGSSEFIYQYTLSTPFDTTTISYDNKSFDLGVEDSANPYDIHFNLDGTRLYVMSTGSPFLIMQYSLSTPWEVSTLVYDNVSLNPLPATSMTYIAWSTDGTKFYIGADGAGSVRLLQFSVNNTVNGIPFVEGTATPLTADATITSTDEEISGFAYDEVSFDISAQEIAPLGLVFNNDGTALYVVGSDSDSIFQYTLGEPFDLSTASYDEVNFSVAGQMTQPYSLTFNTSGLKLFLVGADTATVFEYDVAIPYDVSSITYNDRNFAIAEDALLYDVTFNNDGSKMYIAGGTNNSVYQYTLSTGFDVTTATYDSISFNFQTSQGDVPLSVEFSADGTKMYILGLNNEIIYQYSLSTAFDIATATDDESSLDTRSQDGSPRDFKLSLDEQVLFMVGASTDSVYQYSIVEDAYTLQFATQTFEPGRLIIPDRSIEHTNVNSEQWVEDYIETSYASISAGSRAVQYKFIADEGQEITEARYDLTKLAPGIRDTRGLTP